MNKNQNSTVEKMIKRKIKEGRVLNTQLFSNFYSFFKGQQRILFSNVRHNWGPFNQVEIV